MKRAWTVAVVVFLCASAASGQFAGFGQASFELSHTVSPERVRPGEEFEVELAWKIPPGHYLYREQVSVKPVRGGDFASFDVSMPEGVMHRDEVTPEAQQVFFDELRVVVSCRVPVETPEGAYRPGIEVGWQGCGNGMCFRSESRVVELELEVSGDPVTTEESEGEADSVEGDAADRSLWMWVLGALGGGILTSLTPCVFPLIPVVIAVLGIEPGKTGRLRGLGLSSTYVAGIVTVYAVLGVLAAVVGLSLIHI